MSYPRHETNAFQSRHVRVALALTTALTSALSGAIAHAAPEATASTTPQVPHCAKSLGTMSIQNGDSGGWRGMQLQPPAALLRVVVQQSGCFQVVERGAGLNAALKERELAGSGNLRHGSNVGGGQMRAADYVLLADVVAQNNNAGGTGGIGAVASRVGGVFGAVLGGVAVHDQTAQTTLTLTNVRTTESFSTEGNAKNQNWTWGGAGFLGAGGGALGGYTNTEIGRVVTVAFIDAYSNLVQQAGGRVDSPDAAPRASFVTTSSTPLRTKPGGKGAVLRTLGAGSTVYPLGDKDGLYWKVADENENEGWVNNDKLRPANK